MVKCFQDEKNLQCGSIAFLSVLLVNFSSKNNFDPLGENILKSVPCM